ncbi:hypothetical protein TNCV_4234631 [Trichonephila clavipes]|nr:hypothetical protein TNCV_4234631 [Trichonephila clavipes]
MKKRVVRRDRGKGAEFSKIRKKKSYRSIFECEPPSYVESGALSCGVTLEEESGIFFEKISSPEVEFGLSARIFARESRRTASEIRFPSRSTLSGPKRSRLGPVFPVRFGEKIKKQTFSPIFPSPHTSKTPQKCEIKVEILRK